MKLVEVVDLCVGPPLLSHDDGVANLELLRCIATGKDLIAIVGTVVEKDAEVSDEVGVVSLVLNPLFFKTLDLALEAVDELVEVVDLCVGPPLLSHDDGVANLELLRCIATGKDLIAIVGTVVEKDAEVSDEVGVVSLVLNPLFFKTLDLALEAVDELVEVVDLCVGPPLLSHDDGVANLELLRCIATGKDLIAIVGTVVEKDAEVSDEVGVVSLVLNPLFFKTLDLALEAVDETG